jgi:VanZ family protein
MTRVPVWLRRLAPVVYAAFIFWLSSQPMPVFFGPLSLNDKLKHLALYGVFAWLVHNALAPSLRGRAAALFWLTVGIISLYGASDEIHQYFVSGRSADVLDWAVDTLAAVLVAGVVHLFATRWKSVR